MTTRPLTKIFRFLMIFAILFCFYAIETQAQVLDVEWQCGSGNYSDVAKWSLPAVPCNDAGVTFNVTIPANCGTVTVDLSCEVNNLTLGDNTTFLILAGVVFDVLANTDIEGIVVSNDGDFDSSSASFPGNRARVRVDQTGDVRIPAPTYSSTGLRFNNSPSGSVLVTTTELFKVSDAGSLLDLSALTMINAGFSQSSNDVNRHEIIAEAGGNLLLSSLTTTVGPSFFFDFLRFQVDGTGQMNLNSLDTVSTTGRGRVRFDALNGGSMSLPSLTNVSETVFSATGGSTITANASIASYSSIDLTTNNSPSGSVATTTTDLLRAADAGSVLDLGSFTTIDSGFNQNSNDVNRHEITAEGGGRVLLPSVTTITGPSFFSDWLRFNVDDPVALDLSALTTVTTTGRGRVKFDLTDDATLALPSLQSVEDADFTLAGPVQATLGPLTSVVDSRFVVSAGATLTEGGASSTLSSTGLTFNNSPLGSVATTTIELLKASDSGSILDLASLTAIDAGFNQSSNDVNRHEIIAENGGSLVLSSVTTATGPSFFFDFLRFQVNGAGQIDLSDLATVSTTGRGRVRFDVFNGGSMSLPSLADVSEAVFQVTGGSTLTANSSTASYTSVALTANNSPSGSVATTTTDLFTAADAGSVLDLGALTTINAGFNQSSNDINRHEITASGGAAIGLSGVTHIVGPAFGSDWLRFNASGAGSAIDLSSLGNLQSGFIRFSILDSGLIQTGDLSMTSSTTINVAGSGTLALGDVEIGAGGSMTVTADGTVSAGSLEPVPAFAGSYGIDLGTGLPRLEVQGLLDLGGVTTLTAANEATLALGGRFTHRHSDILDYELGRAIVQFDGGAIQQVEVGGSSVSILRPGDSNFGFGQMVIGETQTTTVELEDVYSNRAVSGQEVLYLLGLAPGTTNPYGPSGLRVLNGSTLVLNCADAYLFDDDQDPFGDLISDLIPLGQSPFPFDDGFISVGDDPDADGFAPLCDNCPFTFNPAQVDTDDDAVGDLCDNCPIDRNPSQSDDDSDLEGDVCDLDDGIIYMSFPGSDSVEWQEEQGFMTWNLYRGDLDVLKTTGVYTQLPGSNFCANQECGLLSASITDTDTPPQGTTCFYLVSGESLGTEGGLGEDSGGNLRPHDNPCP